LKKGAEWSVISRSAPFLDHEWIMGEYLPGVKDRISPALANCLFCLFVEDVHVGHIEHDLHLVTNGDTRAWINTGDKVVLTTIQVQEDFIAH
jgi:hypothetical protein